MRPYCAMLAASFFVLATAGARADGYGGSGSAPGSKVPDPTASTDVKPTGQAKPVTQPHDHPDKLAATDKDFLEKSARADVLEIRLGRLAGQQGANPKLKEWAGHMVTDHTTFTRQRDELVAWSDAKLPKDLDGPGQAEVDRLSGLHQAAFDKPFLDTEIRNDQQLIAATKDEVAHGSNPDVVAWAKGTLPIVEQHLHAARDLEKQASS